MALPWHLGKCMLGKHMLGKHNLGKRNLGKRNLGTRGVQPSSEPGLHRAPSEAGGGRHLIKMHFTQMDLPKCANEPSGAPTSLRIMFILAFQNILN